MFCDN